MKTNESKQPGIAMIGSGFVAYLHLFGIRSAGLGKFTAIAAYTQEEANQRGRLFDAEPYSSARVDELLARPDIDLVIIGSPNKLHAEHAALAIAADKAILVEKPLVLAIEDAEQLCAAERNGARIGYAENHLFAPIMIKARALAAEGAVGRIRRVTGNFGNPAISSLNWHHAPAVAGGGVFVDLGAHIVPGCEFLAGDASIAEVTRAEMRFDSATGIDIEAKVAFRTESDVELITESMFGAAGPGCFYEIEGDAGVLTAHFMPDQELALKGSGSEPQAIAFPSQDDRSLAGRYTRSGYGPQIAHFVEAFASGRAPRLSAPYGRDTLRWLCAGYVAAATGRRVDRDTAMPEDCTPIECGKA